MEDRKFNLLLHDVKSGKYNVNKIQILECYIAQRFTVTQMLLLIQPLTTSDAKLKGFNLLVKEMLVCKTEEAICLVSSLRTEPKHIDNQLICLGELLKHKKVNLDESDKRSLLALFEGTTTEEEACKLLEITPQSVSTKLPAQHQIPPAGATFHHRTETPDRLPIASDCTPGLRQATATITDTFSQYPQAKISGTPGQPPHIIPSGTPGQPPHIIPSGTPGQPPHIIPSGTPSQPPHTLQRGTLGQYPYSIPNTGAQPLNPSVYHNSIPTYPPHQMYHHTHDGPSVPQFSANVINPSAIGFIVPEDTPHPPQPQTTVPNGPPPGLGSSLYN